MRRRCVWLVAQACVLVGLVGLPQEASGQAKIAIGIRANTENPTNPNVPYGDPLVFGSLQNPPGLEHWYWGIESHGWVTLPAPPAGGQSVWFVQVKEVRHSVYGVWQGWNARMMTMDNWNAAGTFLVRVHHVCVRRTRGLVPPVRHLRGGLRPVPVGGRGGFFVAASCTGYFGW